MELALLVWVISILHPIGTILGILAFLGMLVLLANLICWTDRHSKPFMGKKWTWIVATTTLFLVVTSAVLPNQKTAYIMVGAYAAQRIAEDPKVQQLSGKVVTLIEQKLDQYIEEADSSIKEAVK
jgi:membrane-bound ClpP family serine protease